MVSRVNKLNSIEVVRAFAALLVILFHIQTAFGVQIAVEPFRSIVGGGHRGVDLFFVLSGFIIAFVHRDDLGRPGRLNNYLYNRFVRIFPAVWIVSALALMFYLYGPAIPDKAGKLAPYPILASVLLLPQQGVPLVNVTWTLTYEIFFYVLFAAMIVNIRLGLAVLLAWQGITALIALSGADLGLAGYYFRAICLDFSVGLAAAWLVHRAATNAVPLAAWTGILALGVAGFIVGMWFDSSAVYAAALCAFGSGLIIVALVKIEQRKDLHIPQWLVAIGGASYAIYLVHFSVIQVLSMIVRRLGLPPSELLYFVYVPAGIVAGMVFDSWVDKPIQRRLRQLKPTLLRSHPAAAASGFGPR
ncbi:hypothetical protein FMGBMHLM_4134 [Methylobacterium aerolatum]|nr:hypothetical protein FMGBMHLM_4134 [Methylobacterium aerolatum]